MKTGDFFITSTAGSNTVNVNKCNFSSSFLNGSDSQNFLDNNAIATPVGEGDSSDNCDVRGGRASAFVAKRSTIPINSPRRGALRVVHANVRSLMSKIGQICKLDILMSFLLLHSVLVCGVTETWLCGDDNPPTNQFYNWYVVNRLGRGGRVGIFVRHDVPCREITSSLVSSLFVELEFCSVLCNFHGISVGVVSIYLPQKSESKIMQCRMLLQNLRDMDISNFILCGDFNSWHKSWGSEVVSQIGCRVPRAARRGILLSEVFCDFGVVPTVMPDVTRLGSLGQRDSIVDFFVTSGCRIGNVFVDFPISEHCVILGDFYFRHSGVNGLRRVHAFRSSWDFCREGLDGYFSTADSFSLFEGVKYDHVPGVLNNM